MSEIDAIAARYAAAVYAKDEAAFLALYDEQVVVYDMWDQWAYSGREAWAAMAKAWFGSLGDERVDVRFSPLSCLIEGDFAVWCATVRYAGLSAAGEELRFLEERMTWALRRREGRWLIVHQHSSAPADHKTLKVRLREHAG